MSMILCFLISMLGIGFASTLPNVTQDDRSDFVPRVINGILAKPGDVPYQLSFKMSYSKFTRVYSSFCGGSIIGPNKFVSAAHCFSEVETIFRKCLGGIKADKRTVKKAYAVAGNMNNVASYNSGGQWRRLRRVAIPRGYRFPNHDVAVGFTKNPFMFDTIVNSIPLATVPKDYVGQCLASGYGKTETGKSAPHLLLATMDVLSASTCTKLHHMNMDKYICVGNRVNDVDKGDSGGPLVCSGTNDPADVGKGVLIGIVSGSRKPYGSFFTRVTSYHKFIARGGSSCFRSNYVLVLMCLLYVGYFCFNCFIDN